MNTLNDEQQTVVNAISKMQGSDRLVISGRAGSGKTFAIANAVADRSALFLTPTHAARTVLERELHDNRHVVMTIHSAIGWYKDRDKNLETVERYLPAKMTRQRTSELTSQSSNPFTKASIICVDECSMVGAFLFEAVEEYATEFGLPVVYIGDRFQLPPVRDCEVITKQGFPTITLNKSMRFSENSDMFLLGETLRDAIENRPNEKLPCLFGGDAVQVMSKKTWMEQLRKEYANGEDLLAVTSDNATLHRLRRKVRKVDHDRLYSGDVVMSKQTDQQFRNGEQFTIIGVEHAIRALPDVPGCLSRRRALEISGYSISFEGTDKKAFVQNCEKEADDLRKCIVHLYKTGKLSHAEASRAMDWVDEINRFELSALATVHKSQGRSVDTVYIDTATVLRKPNWVSSVDHLRLLYTAITRPRHRVVFYQMPTYCEPRVDDVPMAA
ncbi:ATP-dependent DNA helicase [Shimia sp.]|uniref:ATP-dependent DNA helicase n=1 Tax=Shimia sp. TaxID=1954381 RepID=UPI003B8B2BF7